MNMINEKSRGAENTDGSNNNTNQLKYNSANSQSQDIFIKARQSINPQIIESLFPGGRWKGKEYSIRSPLRNDENVGSFSINNEGLFFDFASNDCGDFIDLVTKSRNVDKVEAARIIITASSGFIETTHSICKVKASSSSQIIETIPSIPEDIIVSFRPNGSSGVWVYRNQDGKAWSIVIRYDESTSEKKVIPYHFDGKELKTGNPLKENRPLFNMDKLTGNDLPVLIVEGEKCASIVVDGYISTTWIGGCLAVDKSDFAILKDRRVIIWPDADDPGTLAAKKIKTNVPHAEILQVEGRPKGWDIADAVAEEINPMNFIEQCPRATETERPINTDKNDEGEKKGKPRKSNLAMELLKQFPMCRSKDKRYMIRDNQAILIGSRSYKDFLSGEYFKVTGDALAAAQIDEVVNIHRAQAGESDERQIYIRTAAPTGISTYIDLNDGKNTIIEINSNGWSVSENPPVLFFRPPNMETLVMPDRNGSINYLKEVFNLERDEDFPVIVSALCYILRGRPQNVGSYPIIVGTGIEGSAKTTFMKIIKKLVDPGTPQTRTPSNETRDLFIAASNGLILSLDNISFINREMSDAICSLATGGGFARKKNYSDDEEQIFDLCRPILLNGISFERAPDLLSRCIIIELRPIPQEERKTEAEIWSRLEKHRSSIFGGLLNILSNAIREELKMGNEQFNLPRLADFSRFSIALERGNGWEEGHIALILKESIDAALEDKAEGNPLIPIILEYVKEKEFCSLSATELLKIVNEIASDSDKRLSIWPKTPAKLGILLKRDHNVYSSLGIKIKQIKDKEGRRWELTNKKKKEIVKIED